MKNESGETQMPSKSFIFFVIVIIILTMIFFIFLSLLAFKDKNTKLKKQPRRLSIVLADNEEHDETSKRKKSVFNPKNEKKTTASIFERKRLHSIWILSFIIFQTFIKKLFLINIYRKDRFYWFNYFNFVPFWLFCSTTTTDS